MLSLMARRQGWPGAWTAPKVNQSMESTYWCVVLLALGWVRAQLSGVCRNFGLLPFMASIGYQPPLFNYQEDEVVCPPFSSGYIAAGAYGGGIAPPSCICPNVPRDRSIFIKPWLLPIIKARRSGSHQRILPSKLYSFLLSTCIYAWN